MRDKGQRNVPVHVLASSLHLLLNAVKPVEELLCVLDGIRGKHDLRISRSRSRSRSRSGHACRLTGTGGRGAAAAAAALGRRRGRHGCGGGCGGRCAQQTRQGQVTTQGLCKGLVRLSVLVRTCSSATAVRCTSSSCACVSHSSRRFAAAAVACGVDAMAERVEKVQIRLFFFSVFFSTRIQTFKGFFSSFLVSTWGQKDAVLVPHVHEHAQELIQRDGLGEQATIILQLKAH